MWVPKSIWLNSPKRFVNIFHFPAFLVDQWWYQGFLSALSTRVTSAILSRYLLCSLINGQDKISQFYREESNY